MASVLMQESSAQDNQVKEHSSRYVNYEGITSKAVVVLLIIWTVFQVYFTTFGAISAINLRAFHCLFLLLFTFLLFPVTRKSLKQRRYPSLLNLLLIALSIFCILYLVIYFPRVARSGGRLNTTDLYVAGIGILLVFEASRRACGNLGILAAIFLAYNWFGAYIPGALGHNGLTLKRILSTQFWGTQGIFGIGIGVSATYIFLFVLFGSFLKYSGFSKFINDFSLALVGQTPGGPAKVAVMASAAMGMINGSAIANVATTGTITIPLMKQTGYSKNFAGAVEAVASTGGQFCPPIMGAVGFVMAEFLNISYVSVMIAAVIPAFLYYLGLLFAVHFEAKKRGLSGFSKENIPDAIKVIKEQGHLSLPLFLLITLMCCGYTPLYSAVISIVATVLSSYLRADTRMSIDKIILAVTEGARGAISVGVCCVIIGIIIGTVTLTSLGLNMGYVILSVVDNSNILLTGFLTMLMSVVLGMGVPGVAAYVIVQAVAVPVLIKVGIVPICAHMFCLVYACLSNITPPVAMSCYVAAGISGGNQLKTGLLAVRLGLVGFLIPFFFLTNPELLIGVVPDVKIYEYLWIAFTASAGTIALAGGLQNFLLTECNLVERILLILVFPMMLYPGITTDIIGMVLLSAVIVLQKVTRQ
ncbi:TRAP transporter permease [Succinivibrio dextrinosolvens]|uniref:TRAP transporter, 4TM/12TM fusion protein n=1 Tax=Succinivibrio dextrinosolvens TaxID=83771 RepID=A0A662ZEN1_9GAMM|nr:TRAP transporter fused permease subunit [Succinivibrio dextrinosolvens]SFK50597.1 TRAP transporter, 4TM/12TM fusion protein [Succinivibrio dextrinosolvens]